ncbi:ribonuclease H family protein [Aquimarina sp. 2201CG5-10]|uniref:ribonuclease H family protein n=1 Tax=Aquimarina callyspongiae TaxID=3098150 RepID=UPI002AB54B24|nr:ribonuclease H family protein [Aquimarina sp. 2201CG5-10]MDY8135116.1 ribonuclease H family protein [Aquimarina sp. 2201CG5-10]
MAKKEKFYVVWEGHRPGIYTKWDDCKAAVKGYASAKYKSFDSFDLAKKAYNGDYEDYKGKSKSKKTLTPEQLSKIGEPNLYSIAVDAASSGNPGKMEYRGVDTQTEKQLFHQGTFPQGTNNIGEFLALVHGLAYLKKKSSDRILYTDSKIAMGWVKQKVCKTKLKRNSKNKEMFDLVDRAIIWLKENTYTTKIVKWETKAWGEIPADFGRK